MDTDDLINKGVIFRPGPSARGGAGKTLIVTGVGRGGTSLAAAVLFHAGVYMGQHLGEAVYEDQEILHAMQTANRDLLTRLIALRNASHRTWGLKIPSLHAMIEYQDMSLFRNPYLIVMFRDPVAVAERTAIAEYRNALITMRETLDALRNLLGFVHNIAAPALLCSYEKALINPGNFVDTVARFCEISLDDEKRQSVLAVIEPNPRRLHHRGSTSIRRQARAHGKQRSIWLVLGGGQPGAGGAGLFRGHRENSDVQGRRLPIRPARCQMRQWEPWIFARPQAFHPEPGTTGHGAGHRS